jgi:hypothetical protein
MYRLALALIFISTFSWEQTSVDYKLYSIVIQNFIAEGIKYDFQTTEVVIITKYIPTENYVAYYGKEFIDGDEQLMEISLHHDTTKIRLFKNEQIRQGIMALEQEFYQTPTLDENKFDLEPTVVGIPSRKFQSFFKTILGRRIEKGWERYYKKYPGSHGIFMFSKIIYEGDYAIFYAGRRSNGLSGSGDLIIMEKNNDNWSITTCINIWMA